MPLYRCLNCLREAESPTCEPCGLDSAKDPKDARSIVELCILHFDPPHPTVRGRGLGHAACDPRMKVGTGAMYTGEKSVVNCPACKESSAFTSKGTPAATMLEMPVVPIDDAGMPLVSAGGVSLAEEE